MLYLVSTPIGNLEDITLRALETLKKVDFILAEDTRRTKKLLNFYKISTPLISFHEHSSSNKIKQILELLSQNKNLALVTDSGTPAISDPGAKLVKKVFETLGAQSISPIPGPSALTAALSCAGISISSFVFLGFPPHKKARKKFFNQFKSFNFPIVIFESPYRLLKTLKELSEMKNIQIIIFHELTKIHEGIFQGTPQFLLEKFEKDKSLLHGEFTLLIYKN